MNTTSIPIPADLVVQLQQAAQSQGVPVEEFVAVSLAAAVRRAQPRDPFFADDAVFAGETPADMAADHDDYLYGDAS